MKTRGGWRETPQTHQIDLAVRDLSTVSDEELLQVIDQCRAVTGTTAKALSRQVTELDGAYRRLP
jgi:hypothetical protein